MVLRDVKKITCFFFSNSIRHNSAPITHRTEINIYSESFKKIETFISKPFFNCAIIDATLENLFQFNDRRNNLRILTPDGKYWKRDFAY